MTRGRHRRPGRATPEERGVALPAFNLITLEHAEAIVAAASQAGRGVVLALSENAIRYHGGAAEPILAAVHLWRCGPSPGRPAPGPPDRRRPGAPRPSGAPAPYVSSLMYDGGALPYAENVARTKQVVDDGHAFGLWVEAELGYVGGKPGAAQSAHAPGVRTDPDEAAAFVAADRGGRPRRRGRQLPRDDDQDGTARPRADRCPGRAAVPVPLVLHGSSGVPDDELRRAVSAGMTKINIGTALNLAMTASVRSGLAADPDLTDPRRYLGPARTAMQDAVLHLLETLE